MYAAVSKPRVMHYCESKTMSSVLSECAFNYFMCFYFVVIIYIVCYRLWYYAFRLRSASSSELCWSIAETLLWTLWEGRLICRDKPAVLWAQINHAGPFFLRHHVQYLTTNYLFLYTTV